MKRQEYRVEILPAADNIIYEQRETGITHSAFEMEYVLYQAVKDGDTERVKKAVTDYLENGMTVGRLSANSLRQMKYWAIACISVAIHYAILGGMDETDAFNLSDHYIRHVDALSGMEECIEYLAEKALELTEEVHNAKQKKVYSPVIRRILHYIHIHLHEKLTVADLAGEAGLSREYFSITFKKEVGCSVHAYVVKEKLEASKILLREGKKYDEISYNFAFCSESHYIACFKKEYKMTPGEYRRSLE